MAGDTDGTISVADVIRAVEGPLAEVRGEAPEALDHPGESEVLRTVWIAARGPVFAPSSST